MAAGRNPKKRQDRLNKPSYPYILLYFQRFSPLDLGSFFMYNIL